MTLPLKGNPAACPACGSFFPVEEGLAVGMPMAKLQPGHYAICVNCWSLSTTDDGEKLRVLTDADIPKIGRKRYEQVMKVLAEARSATHGAAKA